MKLEIPIKKILIGEIQEFDFIRNNPITSTLGAAALGGAVVHDYHTNNHTSVGSYLGSKMDSAKNVIGSGFDKAKEMTHDLSKPSSPSSHSDSNHIGHTPPSPASSEHFDEHIHSTI